ncbi:hypothetical protein SUNDANCE_174 [Brevibacillus phage Sundance]|uniref:hypothetical protein n=1 Tax=Brevibacillus phage Sundance TaxID=1691958 RepID=UPI0006BC7E56|nr:hypothetical protein AVT09_gp174 [Brevibacillus phage Sundance]ALA47990.1 hypothetical protein SUNDANCE_174 [Brevibacillus phage Sundance]
MESGLTKKSELETKRRIEEMSKNWSIEAFAPTHSYPYVFMKVSNKMIKLQTRVKKG